MPWKQIVTFTIVISSVALAWVVFGDNRSQLDKAANFWVDVGRFVLISQVLLSFLAIWAFKIEALS